MKAKNPYIYFTTPLWVARSVWVFASPLALSVACSELMGMN
jgi:hypothetical protein